MENTIESSIDAQVWYGHRANHAHPYSHADIKAALTAGFVDFIAMRTDVVVLVLVYPVVGALLTGGALN